MVAEIKSNIRKWVEAGGQAKSNGKNVSGRVKKAAKALKWQIDWSILGNWEGWHSLGGKVWRNSHSNSPVSLLHGERVGDRGKEVSFRSSE